MCYPCTGDSREERGIEGSLPSREFWLLPRIQLMVPCSAQVPSVVANHVISVGPLGGTVPSMELILHLQNKGADECSSRSPLDDPLLLIPSLLISSPWATCPPWRQQERN